LTLSVQLIVGFVRLIHGGGVLGFKGVQVRTNGSLVNGVAHPTEVMPPERHVADDVILRLIDVTRVYQVGGEAVRALDGVDLTVARGEFLAIMGRSGSGKSTLLNVVGCLDRPTSGTILLDGEDVSRAPAGRLPRIRREKIGFVFQLFNLIPTLTALENVMLPMEYAGLPASEQRERALAALDAVGVSDRLGHRPSELSGGQQQRVAIARALAPDPAIILADEPTGALDTHIARSIIQLMRRFNRERRQTFILVTHDSLVAEQTDRVIRLSDGRVESDVRQVARASEEELA
jgi:putative ABC transport system ATP-binding protein